MGLGWHSKRRRETIAFGVVDQAVLDSPGEMAPIFQFDWGSHLTDLDRGSVGFLVELRRSGRGERGGLVRRPSLGRLGDEFEHIASVPLQEGWADAMDLGDAGGVTWA